MHGDGDQYDNGVTTYSTLDQKTEIGNFKTVKKLKEFLNTLHEDEKLPELTFRYKNMY